LESAEATCAGDGIEAPDVLDLLAHLVEKSLVLMDPGGMRYRMLETVRAYAGEKLGEAGDEAPTRARHFEHFLGLAEAARPHLAGPVQGLWLKRLDPDRENFIAGFNHVSQAAAGGPVAVRLLHALRPYWINRGELSLGLQMAVETLRRSDLRTRDSSRCMVLFSAGQIAFLSGKIEEAKRYLEECLAIAREIGSAAIMLRVLQPLGMTELARHDAAAATKYLEEALELAEKAGDERETATALNAVAMLYRLRGSNAEAKRVCQRALEIFRALGDQELIGVGLVSLAMVLITLGELEPVPAMMNETLDIARQTGSQPMFINAIDLGCGLAASMERWVECAMLCGAARTLRQRAALQRDAADDAFVRRAVEAATAGLGGSLFTLQQSTGGALTPSQLEGVIAALLAAKCITN
jgi:tetratricopeptide (TPR) repeat protein